MVVTLEELDVGGAKRGSVRRKNANVQLQAYMFQTAENKSFRREITITKTQVQLYT